MALSSLDPLARSGGVLPSADPSALEVMMARNKQEDDLAKGIQALNQKAAADAAKVKSKEKLAAGKQLTELTKGTTFMPHTEASAKFYNDFIMREGKRWQDFDAGVGGDPMKPGTQAWIDRNRDLQAWEQLQASSKQIQDKYGKAVEHVMAHKGDYALDTLERLQEDYANPQYLADGTFPDDPTAFIDLNKAIKTRFEAIKPRVTAWASQDGTASGTFEQVQFDDLKAHSEEMAVENPDLAARLGETYDSYTPEKQQQIQAMMKRHKISEPAAVALDLAVAMFGEGKETEISEQVSDAGYGQKVDEMGAINFIEKGIGMNDPSNRGKTLAEIGVKGDFTTVKELLDEHPGLERFSVALPRDAEIFNGYNGMIYRQTKDVEGKEHNRYVLGISRDPSTGNMNVVSADANGGDVKVSKSIPSERFYSEVMDPLAEYNPELDHKKVGYVYQKRYGPIQGREGNIPLPKKGGALDIENAGELD